MPDLANWKGLCGSLFGGCDDYWVGDMAYAFQVEGALDYFPCRYGTSRLVFRGPRRALDRPYVAVLGGTETYGKYLAQPFAGMLETATDLAVVNLGCINAGIDVYLNEPDVLEVAAKASVTVVQLVGAHNLTNRYYAVHPRRNDRFLHATPLLRSIFRDVDFTEFHFTRHMLTSLQANSAERFEAVADELRQAWVGRMQQLLKRLPGQTVLLWMADHPPARGFGAMLRADPVLVDADMVAAVRPQASAYVEVVRSSAARAQGLAGMSFGPLEAPAAAELPGAAAHREVAQALAPVVTRLA